VVCRRLCPMPVTSCDGRDASHARAACFPTAAVIAAACDRDCCLSRLLLPLTPSWAQCTTTLDNASLSLVEVASLLAYVGWGMTAS
jgi:hypothetical protein